jgi:ABC-type Na+ efflux pump permease subunit
MKNKNNALWGVAIIALVALSVLLIANKTQLVGSAIQAQAEKTPVIMALMMIGMVIVVCIMILIFALYIYTSLALYAIAKRTKTKNAWFAWIPFANIYLMTQIGKVPWWTMFFLCFSFIPWFGPVVVSVFTIVLWWKIAEVRNRPGWWGILMVLPIVNFVLMGILAWAKK